ncbi:hypothetical protein CH259_16215 [Rhodococcus sp. 05-2254-4]|nr:hypothetical protein CH259_16215 [Rhodococcus sp. 05-2254-4]OZE48001.1 hypothetical protein CH261_08810 [Rhodococcus sp. 05-2254-3]OZE49212.1 hypothetical protein CH283_16595 [Rhodococcus sp. 05-2254-2]
MDAEERAAIVDEGFDPDDPAVVEAMLRVRADLRRLGDRNRRLCCTNAVREVGDLPKYAL